MSGAALVSARDGAPTKLDSPAQPPEVVTAEDASDPLKLSRLLTRILSDVTKLRRRFAPRRTTFRDVETTGTVASPQVVRLSHKFGGRVEWWVVGIDGFASVSLGAEIPFLNQRSETDPDTLVLESYCSATFTVRVEEGG